MPRRRECIDRAGSRPASYHQHALARLTQLRFPIRYQQMAQDGIPIFFESPGPTMKGKQPIIADAGTRAKTREKIGKVIKRRYLLTTDLPIKSFIIFLRCQKGRTTFDLCMTQRRTN
jgi:hypothetical protein